jgi:S1-C subfamily serine protease
VTIRYARLLRAQIVVAALLMTTAFAAQNPTGLIIEELVSDSPGRKIGLQAGDRILTYDGKTLPSPSTLQALEQNNFGKKAVAVEVLRGGQRLNFNAPPGYSVCMCGPN